jgi:hypothetical protein
MIDKIKDFLSTTKGKVIGIGGGGVLLLAIVTVVWIFAFGGGDDNPGVIPQPNQTADGDNLRDPDTEDSIEEDPTTRLTQMNNEFICPVSGDVILSVALSSEDALQLSAEGIPELSEDGELVFTYVPTETEIESVRITLTPDGTRLVRLPNEDEEIVRVDVVDLTPLLPESDISVEETDGGTIVPPTGGEDPNGDPGDPTRYRNIIQLNGRRATTEASEENVRIEENSRGVLNIRIRRPGNYTIRGTLDRGAITIGYNNSFPGGAVNLTLDNVSITCPEGPAIRASSRVGSLTVTNRSGTTNTLRDTRPARPNDDELLGNDGDGDEDPRRNAALFSRAPLTVTGSGTLEIRAGHAHGIHARGTTLTLNGARVNVLSAHANGLRSRWAMTIDNSRVNLTVNAKGLRAAGANHGNIVIRNGSVINITSGRDGVHSENNVTINGNSTVNAVVDRGFSRGSHVVDGSREGIRAGGNIVINGGNFTINAAESALNASGTVHVTGATMKLEGFVRGIRGGHGVRLDNSNVRVEMSRIAIHGGSVVGHSHIRINGGSVHLQATESGFNANVPSTLPDRNAFTFRLLR